MNYYPSLQTSECRPSPLIAANTTVIKLSYHINVHTHNDTIKRLLKHLGNNIDINITIELLLYPYNYMQYANPMRHASRLTQKRKTIQATNEFEQHFVLNPMEQ